MKHSYLTISLALAAALFASRAFAADPPPEVEPASESKSLTLDVGVGISSAYVWRGLNLFQDSKQMDQNMMLSPSLTVGLPETGLSFGYWGAYQLTGEGKSELVDAGVGAEQDLIVGYERALSEQLTLSLGLTYYFYPLADEAIAGIGTPQYIEPNAGLSYATFADLGLLVAYYHGIQDEIKTTRHLYVSPSVSKSIELNPAVAIEPKASFGFKKYNDGDVKDNVYDVLLSVGVPITATEALSVTPSANGAWTNLSELDFGDEYVVWGGLEIGYSLL